MFNPRRELEQIPVYDHILQAIGRTPLVRLSKVTRGIRSQVYAKCEFMNPGGSIKDRIGLSMVEAAEHSGQLRPGGTIIEATSGNTGVGLALAAAVKGYRSIFVLPDKMSEEKVRLLRAFGARVIITPTAVEPEDPRSYYSVSKRLAEETPNSVLVGQFWNPANPTAHYRTTGPEIWQQTEGKIDCLVAGMGTGGTITGTGKFLKERNPKVMVVGADPVGSLLYDTFHGGGKVPPGAYPRVYKVEGIGEDFLPDSLDLQYVDDVIQVSDKDSFLMARRLVREEGLFCGGSSGTAVFAALEVARALPPNSTVVVVLPDSGSRYLSKLFDDDWMRENGLLEYPLCEGTVADLPSSRSGELLTARETNSKMSVIETMKARGVSQLPVIDGAGRFLGMVTEGDLLRHLLLPDHEKGESISDIVSLDEAVPVYSNTALDSLPEIFSRGRVAVVLEGDCPTGIVTQIDLIEFLAGRVNGGK